MSETGPENTDGGISENPDSEIEQAVIKKKPLRCLIITLPSLVVLFIAAFLGYCSLSGVDFAWALGTSGWAAPPGSKLAGTDIGGKSLDQISEVVETLQDGFNSLSVWLVEDPAVLQIQNGDYFVSTSQDEFALSVAPPEFGFNVDITAMRREIALLDEKTKDPWKIGSRLKLWDEPPSIPVKLKTDPDKSRAFITAIKKEYDRAPVDARLDFSNRTIAPALDGLNIDVESTLENIPEDIEKIRDFPVKIEIVRTLPPVTDKDFSDIDVEKPLSEYTTKFSIWKRNRSTNIELVAARFEGSVIHPGEIFSFNQTTGPRTQSEGYLLAPMYRNHRPELSPAGGACQVSTTLYNTVLLSGMEIVERHPHSRPCGYVPYGRDAAVAYDSHVDLKFKNTLNHPVIIHQSVDRHKAGTITFEFYGHPSDRVNVKIGNAYSWIPRTDSMTTYIDDLSLDPGKEVVEDEGVNGIVQRAWRIWLDENGVEIKRENLSSDRIRPVGALIRRNPNTPDGFSENSTTVPGDSNEPSPESPPGAF